MSLTESQQRLQLLFLIEYPNGSAQKCKEHKDKAHLCTFRTSLNYRNCCTLERSKRWSFLLHFGLSGSQLLRYSIISIVLQLWYEHSAVSCPGLHQHIQHKAGAPCHNEPLPLYRVYDYIPSRHEPFWSDIP